jgi:sugar lactone lactonase YvrE
MEQTMSALLSRLQSLVLSDSPRSSRRPRRRLEVRRRVAPRRLHIEPLEDRLVLSPTISVANASLNEIGNVSPFVASGSGGLTQPKDLALGPDGNVYVASAGTNSVIRYTPSGQLLGTFVAAGSGGLSNPFGLAFGPDGNLYVSSPKNDAIYEYSGSTGAFLRMFVASGTGGLITPTSIVFGPDGNLYVSDQGAQTVDRFEGPTGPNPGSPLPAAGQSGANFVAPQSGGLFGPRELAFGPNGNLYVDSLDGADNGETVPTTANLGVLEYNGTTGAFVTTFVGSGANGVQSPRGLAFDQDGRLYVADWGTSSIERFDSQGDFIDDVVTPGAGSASSLLPFGMVFNTQGALLVSNDTGNSLVQYNSGVVVTLSAASPSPVTVQYATSDGTALAGTDYTAQTGTVTFAPGQTSRLIPLVTLYDATPPANDSFNVSLSNPSGATIANGNAVVTITPPTLPQLTVGNTSAIEGDPTAHYRGVAAAGATTGSVGICTIGPDGNIYTATGGGYDYNMILRYNGTTGAFMGVFATGPINGVRTILFNGGYMYVASEYTNQVLQYNATTGAYVGVFVAAGSGGISGPYGMTFGPDGNLYVSGRNSNNVVEYNGTTGALIETFVTAGSGGLDLPEGITFDPSGQYLYVASSGGPGEVLKYSAQTGAYVGQASSGLSSGPGDVQFGANGLLYVGDGNRIEEFTENGIYTSDYVPAGSGGMTGAGWMTFGPNGDLYVGSGNHSILQFGTENEALFTVTLSAPFAEPVTVNYATTDGTAVAGTNYTATSGTLTFASGVTTQTIRVPILDSGSQTAALTFAVNLSNPQLATLSQSQATGTIEPSDQAAKFYVVNDATPSIGGTNTAYKYQASGTAQAPFGLSLNDLDPRGVTSNAAGTTQWVVDANKNVYVYSPGGTLLGSWTAGGLSSSAALTGIATNGTDIWLVDSYTDKVYKYTGAASRLSGSQNAASSFSLAGGRNGDPNPQDIVTDGTSFWVVDGTRLKVFKYTLSGSLHGSWAIDPADNHPTGITINPSNVSDVWIVDNGTLKVYQYVGAASRTSGSQNAGATFALNPSDTNPQGIADPPPEASLLSLNPPSTAESDGVSSEGPSAVAGVGPLASRDAAFALLGSESPPLPGRPSPGLATPLADRALALLSEEDVPVINRVEGLAAFLADPALTPGGTSAGSNVPDQRASFSSRSTQGLHIEGSAADPLARRRLRAAAGSDDSPSPAAAENSSAPAGE